MDKKIIGKIIKIMAKTKDQSNTKPKNNTLNRAEDKGSLALITETTKGETKETAFIEIKNAKAVPKKAIIRQIKTLQISTTKEI